MDRHTSRTTYRTSKLGLGTVAKVVALAGVAVGMAGCETDSFMLDPSVVGRWEHTPARVPILTRIASIEGPGDDFVEYSDIRPDDLLPEITEYRIGPGDRLTVIVFDIPDEGRSVPFPVVVDTRGAINLPQLGELNLNGLSVRQAEQVVMNAMRELVANPLASIRSSASILSNGNSGCD
ncbi:polysaccharide biosynthesis/export family protein [Leptolyngbya sp. 7M]|uniref:polysaccharide biosynthesis/export family protein n=1 Tax=Leptolyngbya sp. 7M TaxID=2812896 RepID=UPI001B8CE9E0|nr:polysaccharide biosynthesis/export family protein [Leptolyngbya sp. 7M]QYO61926.1 polysaccharide biosynthesis/export family protein [Leptolyngbya sp. 7M]